jgi:hypothetical protein
MGTVSRYVLERRLNPALRNAQDMIRLARAEAKRKRKQERKARHEASVRD